MLETALHWLLRGILLLVGAGAAFTLFRALRDLRKERRERWAVRLAFGMVLLAAVYAAGHARLLLQAETIREGRMKYTRFGDPRLAELNRAEVRGWILDCSGRDDRAMARYALRDGEVRRVHPLGEAGANLVGGGSDAGERDYTVERLFDPHLSAPRSWAESGELHPAGADLRLTLCAGPTRAAWELLRRTGRPGAVVVQEVETGALVAYAATGGPGDAPVGIRQYAPPGSVFKLALAALWWEEGLGDRPLPCPPSIQVTPRATISNSGGVGHGTVNGPAGMLVPSCNTSAVTMALTMRERLGTEPFLRAYRRFGFEPYETRPPTDTLADFWRTDSDRWARRMAPAPSRVRMSESTGRAEWAQLAIGQGPVDVTPIAVSRFVQAIGNGGVMHSPTVEWDLREAGRGERVMRLETSRKLVAAMREVVDRGTARSAAPLVDGSGWDLAGKTGTAQVANRPDDGWFAGLVLDPEGRPRYTVVVYLRGGGPGGARPAAIAARMVEPLSELQGAEERR